MAEENIDKKPWLWRPPRENGYVGRRGLRPKEAPEKVTGRAIYTNDIFLPGMLYLKIYRSPYAHARIKSMDSSKAEALPGVWAVIRYDDPDIDFHDFHGEQLGFMWMWWRESILPDTADFQSVRVGAMVVAESEEICDQALKLIGEGIEWEHLPIILDPEEAAKPDAPLMHPERNLESNVWKDTVTVNIGDVDKGFVESDHVIEFSEYKKEDDNMGGVEPGCVIARWKGEELEYWYHGQHYQPDLGCMVSSAFKNDDSKPKKLKIHTPYNGGSFGGNSNGVVAQLTRYAAIASRITLRPVKVVDDYAMSWEGISFEVGTAHYKVGFNNDGTIVAIRIDVYQKTGIPLSDKFIDSLKTPNVNLHEIHSYWSRGHEHCWKDGAANCTLVNLIINKVAVYLGMDPTEVQLLNDGAEGHDMEWLNENVKKRYGMPIRDSLKEVIDAGKAAFDWDRKWHPPGARKLPNGKMHGVGFYGVSSWTSRLRRGFAPGIGISQDGRATIFFRRCDNGQSAPTTYCQIVAEEIGLRYEDVEIEFTEFYYFDAFPPVGSAGASANSPGLVLNARKMKKLILEYALKPIPIPADIHGYEPPPKPPFFEGKKIEDLDIAEGVIFEKANPENSIPVSTLTSVHAGGILNGIGPFFVGDATFEFDKVEKMFPMARQACFIEVEVDTETGQVDVTNLVHSYDLGQSLNPDVNDQQLFGGAYPGIGVSSIEAIYYDPHTGVKLNDNLLGYPILTTLDLGRIQCPIVETHVGYSAYGLFGCSEAGKAATGAALLVPAVYNAIGEWIEDTPVTPDRVLKALGKA